MDTTTTKATEIDYHEQARVLNTLRQADEAQWRKAVEDEAAKPGDTSRGHAIFKLDMDRRVEPLRRAEGDASELWFSAIRFVRAGHVPEAKEDLDNLRKLAVERGMDTARIDLALAAPVFTNG